LQKAQRRIADFLGLKGFIFVVLLDDLPKNQGGNIHLKRGETEVDVTISEGTAEFPSATLATIAHEITHKYLEVNGVVLKEEAENEVLTDVAAVFLGLGKIMVNGCLNERKSRKDVAGGYEIRTRTLSTGYLDPSQFALVYRLVCTMRNVDLDIMSNGIKKQMLDTLYSCETKSGVSLDWRFHEPESLNGDLTTLQHKIGESQMSLARVENRLTYAKRACIQVADSLLDSSHKRLWRVAQDVIAKKRTIENTHDPCLRYLDRLLLSRDIMAQGDTVDRIRSSAGQFAMALESTALHIHSRGDQFKEPSPDVFGTVMCRQDGTKIEAPKGQAHHLATCPECSYEFLVDTRPPKLDGAKENRIKSLLGRSWRRLWRRHGN